MAVTLTLSGEHLAHLFIQTLRNSTRILRSWGAIFHQSATHIRKQGWQAHNTGTRSRFYWNSNLRSMQAPNVRIGGYELGLVDGRPLGGRTDIIYAYRYGSLNNTR
jgi:hypothetical protein